MQLATKVKTFEEELSWIPSDDYRRYCEDCIVLSPNYFFEVSASDSNNNHPYWDLGPGGTARHTKAVTKTAKDLAGTILRPEDKENLSKLLTACILHDSFKYGFSFDLRMFELHPYIPRVALFKVTTGGIPEEQKDWIFRAIESHMGSYRDGKWAPLHYITYANLHNDPLAYLVHQADFLVSRQDYVFEKFRDINKDVDINSLPHYEPFPNHMLKGIVLGVLLEHMAEEDIVAALKDGSVDNLVSRVAAMRSPYSTRRKVYNYEGLIKATKENMDKFIPKKG
jgi:hypothetical protein